MSLYYLIHANYFLYIYSRVFSRHSQTPLLQLVILFNYVLRCATFLVLFHFTFFYFVLPVNTCQHRVLPRSDTQFPLPPVPFYLSLQKRVEIYLCVCVTEWQTGKFRAAFGALNHSC